MGGIVRERLGGGWHFEIVDHGVQADLVGGKIGDAVVGVVFWMSLCICAAEGSDIACTLEFPIVRYAIMIAVGADCERELQLADVCGSVIVIVRGGGSPGNLACGCITFGDEAVPVQVCDGFELAEVAGVVVVGGGGVCPAVDEVGDGGACAAGESGIELFAGLGSHLLELAEVEDVVIVGRQGGVYGAAGGPPRGRGGEGWQRVGEACGQEHGQARQRVLPSLHRDVERVSGAAERSGLGTAGKGAHGDVAAGADPLGLESDLERGGVGGGVVFLAIECDVDAAGVYEGDAAVLARVGNPIFDEAGDVDGDVVFVIARANKDGEERRAREGGHQVPGDGAALSRAGFCTLGPRTGDPVNIERTRGGDVVHIQDEPSLVDIGGGHGWRDVGDRVEAKVAAPCGAAGALNRQIGRGAVVECRVVLEDVCVGRHGDFERAGWCGGEEEGCGRDGDRGEFCGLGLHRFG